MRNTLLKRFGILAGSLAFAALALRENAAFPPAPDHVFYGMVRDEMGNPLELDNAEVLLETSSGVQVRTSIVGGLEPGVNYRLSVPMDAGITDDAYKPTALRPTVPFRIWVRINSVRYLPLQMKGDYSQLGQPGKRTHLDLTLGEDSDGDGLPDAWERALISMLGGKLTLADINPNDDADHDGLSNLQEYLAGTYAFDDQDGFSLKIVRTENGNPILEFLAIKGRSYRVLGSTDLKTWTQVNFRPAGSTGEAAPGYFATDTRVMQIEAPASAGPALSFYKLVTN